MANLAIVFGHSSGLGLELTKIFIDKGYEVVGISHTQTPIESKQLTSIVANLLELNQLQQVVDDIKSKYSNFDTLIYSAGVLAAHDMAAINYNDIGKLYGVNTFAPMYIESQLLENIKNNGAYVVNVSSSTVEHYHYPNLAVYSSSKAALAKFTKDLEKELKGTGARVMDFCPAGFTSNIYKQMSGDKVDRDESSQMDPADLARIILAILETPRNIEIPYIFANRK